MDSSDKIENKHIIKIIMNYIVSHYDYTELLNNTKFIKLHTDNYYYYHDYYTRNFSHTIKIYYPYIINLRHDRKYNDWVINYQY